MKLLFDDGDEYIGRHGAPDLCLHCVFARAEKFLDAQVLLDPFEEQFDLPTLLVQRGDRQRRQGCIVGQEDQGFACVGILESNAPQMLGIILRNIKAVHRDRLVADHAGRAVDCGRVHAPGVHVAFCAGDEERASLMQFVESCKVQIAAIHDLESARFDRQEVQHIDLVHLAVADMDECWNSAAQIQQGMQFHRRLCCTKRRPIEQRQAQVDRRRIERVDRVGQIQAKIGVSVQFMRASNEQGRKVGSNTPIPRLVRIGQGRPVNAVAQSHRIQLAAVGSQRHFDVSQGFAPGQLCKRHDAKLFRASQSSNTCIAGIAIHDAGKTRPRHKLHDLCEQRLAYIHGAASQVSIPGSYTKMKNQDSNRHQIKSAAKSRQY